MEVFAVITNGIASTMGGCVISVFYKPRSRYLSHHRIAARHA